MARWTTCSYQRQQATLGKQPLVSNLHRGARSRPVRSGGSGTFCSFLFRWDGGGSRRLAGCWLASCSSAAAAARVNPPATPGRGPRRFAGAAPGLAPCRPLIGASSRPLGREARWPSAARGVYGRRRERRRKGTRPSAAGRARGRAGRGESPATASPPPFAYGPPRLPAGPAAPAANQHAGSSGCEPRVGGLESEGRRRLLIGPASPV